MPDEWQRNVWQVSSPLLTCPATQGFQLLTSLQLPIMTRITLGRPAVPTGCLLEGRVHVIHTLITKKHPFGTACLFFICLLILGILVALSQQLNKCQVQSGDRGPANETPAWATCWSLNN